jgi:hypothetical protein
VFSALRAGIGAVQSQIVSFVEKANPAAVQKFKFAVDDLTGVIGRALTPVLVNMTALIQKLADYFYALGPGAKVLLAGLTAAAVGFTVVAVGVWGLNAAFSTLTGGLSTILGAIGAMAVGVMFAASGTDSLKGALDAMMGPLSSVLDIIGEIVSDIVSALAPVVETVFAIMAAGMRMVADALKEALPYLQKVVAWFRAIAEFAAEILGIQLAAGGGPPKAPAAVRQAQIGGLNDFINRQMVNALQSPAKQQDPIEIGRGIAKDVAECRAWLEKIFNKPEAIRAGLQGIAPVIRNVAEGGAFGPMGVAAEIAMRIVGK